MANRNVLLEVCIDNLVSAISAEAGGAKRIELCSSLAEGGLTPSVGFLKIVKCRVTIPVFVMIRPRGGDFIYSEDEIRIMEEDIKILKANGADGFVFGVLKEDGTIDTSTCARLLSSTTSLPSTFHRAFDLTLDPTQALEAIIQLGFRRILTSGQARTAPEGLELIKLLALKADGRLIIMAGAGVTPDNVASILDTSAVSEVHASCRKKIIHEGRTSGAGAKSVQMGSTPDEMNIYVTDKCIVEAIVSQFPF